MHVVATAGHVDHGKSTLVRALTGQDPDRLGEEKRRGLTIELGYCWASWDDVGEVAFVDVPGHERFISTMLAGVGPVPVVMLVVAADDPWMPQAAEHVAALDALGVDTGVLVVTRSDLADPGPALARARDGMHGTSLADLPGVAVSARTGAGLEELRETLARVLAAVPSADPTADVRLWVDRRFQIRGVGTVVTGTLPAGAVAPGDELEVDGERVRVRSVEALGRPREQVTGVARVALDLAGRVPDALSRGTALVTPGAFELATVVDVRVAEGERVPQQPVLHVGSAAVGTRVHHLAPDVLRVRLERPLPLRYGDRALLRDPGDRHVWGIRVLDAAPPRRRRDIASHDGTPEAELRLRGVARRSFLRRIGAPVFPLPDGTVSVDDWLVPPAEAERLRRSLVDLVDRRARTPQEIAHELRLPDAALVPALMPPSMRIERGRVTSARESGPDPRLLAAAAELRAQVDGFQAPPVQRVTELGLGAQDLATLHHAGLLLWLEDRVVLQPGADERALEILSGLPQPFTASEARTALGTSRRVVLPLLAHLDRQGRTVRLADDRRRVRGAAMD